LIGLENTKIKKFTRHSQTNLRKKQYLARITYLTLSFSKVDTMKLRLRITKKETKDYTKPQYRFTVIDLDKSKQYPQNFVCILPKTIKEQPKPNNAFEKIFSNESKKIATHLLQKALRSRPDPETTKSIRDRLKILKPKPVLKSTCQNCGKTFESNKKKYKRYVICYECYKKKYSNS
jgi:hypothetical protein